MDETARGKHASVVGKGTFAGARRYIHAKALLYTES
jgi:hypothetical protein